VATLLKQASATASEHATEDQASDHAHQTHPNRDEFELNITEDPPTSDQLRTILDYVGDTGVGSIVEGASTASEALKKYRENKDAFKRPVVRIANLAAS
jgi:arsenate reductase-like glutaredoxin family protein